MNIQISTKVTADRKLELPPEIRNQLQPGDEYMISFTENSIILHKVSQDNVNLEQFFERLEEAEPDANQPSLAEISQMVKENRQKKRADLAN